MNVYYLRQVVGAGAPSVSLALCVVMKEVDDTDDEQHSSRQIFGLSRREAKSRPCV